MVEKLCDDLIESLKMPSGFDLDYGEIYYCDGDYAVKIDDRIFSLLLMPQFTKLVWAEFDRGFFDRFISVGSVPTISYSEMKRRLKPELIKIIKLHYIDELRN